MSDRTGAVKDQAIGWLIRQRDGDFDDWEGFEAWLAADAAHARAWHETAAADRDLDALLADARWPAADSLPEPANDVAPTRRRWIVAVAASLAAVSGTWFLWPAHDLYPVETRPGERRVVQLADSRIELNGATRLMLDRRDPRYAAIEHGQAMFDVHHDTAHPFRVQAGDRTLVDAGTAFEVTSEPDRLVVAVSEGLVIADPDGQSVRIPAGARMVERRGQAAELSSVPAADVATWRQGQLVYDGAPIQQVAADLQRNLGVSVKVADAARARTVRGVLRLDGGAEPTMGRLGVILGVRVEKSGKGWVIGGP